ncbi:MAG: cell division protein FtsL [Notoacmeibacter sp.]
MFRRTDIAMIAAMIAVVGYTYSVKTGTKEVAEQLAAINRETEAEINAIDLLNADWEVLTAPKRIQSLVTIYQSDLNLVPIDAKRLIAINDIPMRPDVPAPETSIDDILAQFGDADLGLTTGSIKKPTPKAAPEPTIEDVLEGDGIAGQSTGGDQ